MSSNHHVAINMAELNNRDQGHNANDHVSNNNNHHSSARTTITTPDGDQYNRSRSRRSSSPSINDQRFRSPTRTRRAASPHQRTNRDVESAINDAEPLLETDSEMIPKIKPPIANPELDDDNGDERPDIVPNTPEAHSGVDDAFYPVDFPHHDHHADDGPPVSFGPRIGDDNGRNTPNGIKPRRPSVSRDFPYAPEFPKVYVNGDGVSQIIPDVNVYQQKKTLAQGMMDLALLSANANQLRYVLESYSRHPYYYFSLSFISISIILQIAVGIGLIWNSRYNVKNDEQICKADRISNFTIMGIFGITVVNVFISSFGVADAPADMKG